MGSGKGVIDRRGAQTRRTLPNYSGDAGARGANPFLEGIYAPIEREHTIEGLDVTGRIPDALDGVYLRIGPNPVRPNPATYHPFVGDGMVHALALSGGSAHWYRNRWIRSNAVAAAIGVAPASGLRRGRSEAVNTSVVAIGADIFALMEAGSPPVRLSPDLERQNYDALDGTLEGAFTAHPKPDVSTGELHAICYDPEDRSTLTYVVVGIDGKVRSQRTIAVAGGPMVHDCGLTSRFVVVLDLPVARAEGERSSLPYRWQPRRAARVGLLPRGDAAEAPIWCEVKPGFAFHIANAFDRDDGQVVLDLCVYETMFDGAGGFVDPAPRGLERWTVDPRSRRVAVETLDPTPQDFPRIDQRRSGRPHRYVYTVEVGITGVEGSSIFKNDLALRTRITHDFGPNRHPGEFVFVPASVSAAEDEGWLLGLVIDRRNDVTDMVILDAAAIDAAPVAIVHIPHRIPPGFHGNWFPRSLETQRGAQLNAGNEGPTPQQDGNTANTTSGTAEA